MISAASAHLPPLDTHPKRGGGSIHAARLDHSPRLQRVVEFLADGRWHSTREIIRGADVCAVNSCIDELRAPINGFRIERKQEGKYFYYRLPTRGAE